MDYLKGKNSIRKKWARNASLIVVGGSMLLAGSAASAAPVTNGNCAALPATRADQFHGNG